MSPNDLTNDEGGRKKWVKANISHFHCSMHVCVFGYRATSVKIHFPAELDNASISNVFVTKNICARTGKHIKENVCEKK